MGRLIVVACGAGINTSTLGEDMIKERLEAEGRTDVAVKRVLMANIEKFEDEMDIMVSMMKVYREFKCPIVKGLPFLIGTRDEQKELLDHIMKLLDDMDNQ
jgi:galactitol-specific phosphotransferase system IIB component